MTYIPITPQHSGFGNFKLPSTDAEWDMFHLFVRIYKETGIFMGMKK